MREENRGLFALCPHCKRMIEILVEIPPNGNIVLYRISPKGSNYFHRLKNRGKERIYDREFPDSGDKK